jgi:hypothetical protein
MIGQGLKPGDTSGSVPSEKRLVGSGHTCKPSESQERALLGRQALQVYRDSDPKEEGEELAREAGEAWHNRPIHQVT